MEEEIELSHNDELHEKEVKVYCSHDEQLQKLKQRNLFIEDEQIALEHLRREGYYNVINGYSEFFKTDPQPGKKRKYLKNATFNNIMALYNFDKGLRSMLYKYTSLIECYVKEAIAHEFSRVHGVMEGKYLTEECFSNEDIDSVKVLIVECNKVILDSTNKNTRRYRKYIAHNIKKYNHIPMWILVRALTFGNASKFFKNMKTEEKEKIASFYKLTAEQMTIMLEFVVLFRNIVAHGERTFCAKRQNLSIPNNLSILPKLNISINENGEYEYGRYDLFALLICCRYFLTKEEIHNLVIDLNDLFDILEMQLSGPTVGKIKIQMGLANNGWKNLDRINV